MTSLSPPRSSPPAAVSGAPHAGRAGRAAYWLYAGHLWAILGIAASNILLGLSLLATPFAARSARLPSLPRAIAVPLGLYALFTLVSCVTSHDPSVSLPEGGKLLFSAMTLLLALLLVRGERAVRRIVDGVLVVGGVAAASGLVQLLGGFGDLQLRIQGPFSHYMTLAGILLLVDSLLIAQLVCGIGRRSVPRWLLLVVVNIALVGSLTRSAWIALAVALAVLLAIRSARWLWLYVPAVLLLVMIAPATVKERIASIADVSDASNYDRICMAQAGLHMIAERPLFGIGPHMVRELYPIYRTPSAPTEEVPHLHNTYIQIAAETGLPTLAVFLVLLFGAMGYAYRGYRRAAGTGVGGSDLYAGVLVALVAFSVAGLFEDNWSDGEVKRVMLFLLAVPYCLERRSDRLSSGTATGTAAESSGAG